MFTLQVNIAPVYLDWKNLDLRDIHSFPHAFTELAHQLDSMAISSFWLSLKTA